MQRGRSSNVVVDPGDVVSDSESSASSDDSSSRDSSSSDSESEDEGAPFPGNHTRDVAVLKQGGEEMRAAEEAKDKRLFDESNDLVAEKLAARQSAASAARGDSDDESNLLSMLDGLPRKTVRNVVKAHKAHKAALRKEARVLAKSKAAINRQKVWVRASISSL